MFNKRFKPWYDNHADYNTNSNSYYNYQGRSNKHLHLFTDMLNRVLRRDVAIKDTVTIDLTKTGDWQDNCECTNADCEGCCCTCYDDVVTLSADVIFSKTYTEKKTSVFNNNEVSVINGSKQVPDGVWSPDYGAYMDNEYSYIKSKFASLDSEISAIKTDIANIQNEIASIKSDITNLRTDLSSLQTTVTNLNQTVVDNHQYVTQAIQKLLNNLYASGAITTNNIGAYEFVSGRNIASGTINLFSGADQGSAYIRTNSGATENDIVSGVGV